MSNREVIEPHDGDKRYVQRDDQARFKDKVDISASRSRPIADKGLNTPPDAVMAIAVIIR